MLAPSGAAGETFLRSVLSYPCFPQLEVHSKVQEGSGNGGWGDQALHAQPTALRGFCLEGRRMGVGTGVQWAVTEENAATNSS